MSQGLPPFAPPPFSTSLGNRTYSFLDMAIAMDTRLFTIPVVSAIEHIAIAKAFGNWISFIRSSSHMPHEITLDEDSTWRENRKITHARVECAFPLHFLFKALGRLLYGVGFRSRALLFPRADREMASDSIGTERIGICFSEGQVPGHDAGNDRLRSL